MAELFGLLFFALAVLLFFGLVISLIILIVMAARKKPVKNAGIMSGVLGGSFIFVVVLMFVALANVEDTVPQTSSYPTSSSDAQQTEEVIEEDKPENEDEIETDLATEESDDSHLTNDGSDPTDFSEYNADVDMTDIERNPAEYTDEWIAFEGRIIQVIEDDVMTAYRIAVNDDIDRVVYVETLGASLEERLLEDDHVEVYGSFYDLVTYETVIGNTQTIPAFNAHGERIILQETTE
ncbi:hypothetical protein [Salinicoccus sp. Marseille-QA3877]